ncbi:mRNA turnover and stability protein [Tubulinosema ratisbonensis]|uniref:RING-type E3 ubiquitin transferase n=1 Tax=Tubulinosema ratisbonensis TaxID=291195 RepID=A0A437AKE6_9MICR|nr:mRNA turnover and stability protein [Tubulinosema ratisbonensis]
MFEEEQRNAICKICLQTQSEEETFPNCHPCKCAGTLKYVHRSCLNSWLSKKSITKCELCFFEYKFNNVYKPSMPKELNSITLITIMCLQIYFGVLKLSKVLFNISAYMFSVYAVSFFYSFIFLRDRSLLVDYHFFGGPLLSLIIYSIKLFLKKIDNKLQELERRGIRGVNTQESFWYEGDRDTRSLEGSFSIVIHITEEKYNFQERINTQEENFDFGQNSDDVEDFLFSREESPSYMSLDTSIISVMNVSIINFLRGVFYLLFLKSLFILSPFIRKLIFLFGDNFNNFLEITELTNYISHVSSITFSILILTYTLRRFKNVYYRCKVMSILFINFIFNPTILGIFVKYCFFHYLNKNSSLLSSDFFHTPFFLSINTQFIISYFIGFILILSVIKILLFFKEMYRPGALYFIINAETRDPIEEIMLSKFHSLIINYLVGLPCIIIMVNLVFLMHSYTLKGIKFQIQSIEKLIFYFMIAQKMIGQINLLNIYLKKQFKILTFLICKSFGCLDYFYGIKDRIIKKNELKILPNRSEIFNINSIKENYKKSFNDEEFDKFYVNRITGGSTFAIFRIPSFFKVRYFLIHFILFLILQLQIHLILKVTINLTKTIQYFFKDNIFTEKAIPFDLCFLLCLYYVLFLINFLLCFFVKNVFNYAFNNLGKFLVSFSFRYFIWPFLILNFILYSFHKTNNHKIFIVYPITKYYFYITSLLNCVYDLITLIFYNPTNIITGLELFKRLIFITIIPTSMVLCSLFYDNMVTVKNVEFSSEGFIVKNLFLYLCIFALVLFFVFLFAKRFFKFIVNWREEFYLERRELLNYEGLEEN